MRLTPNWVLNICALAVSRVQSAPVWGYGLEQAMSYDGDGTQNTPLSPNRSRRRFLEKSALATAAALLPASDQGVVRAATGTPRGSCQEIGIPMKDVAGKVAFITGASSGIGLGIARAFAGAGMKVVIGYRTKKHLEEAMSYFEDAQDRVLAIDVDVTDRQAMEKAASEALRVFGKVHVLVNNAGVVQHAPLSSTTYDDWDWQMKVNLDGVFNGVHVFLPHLRAHGEGGQIISTSSILGLFTGVNSAVYSASKYAVVGMMESLRAELSATNIGVSIFCPGLVTSSIQDSGRNRPSDLAQSAPKPDSKAQALERELRNDPERAMDPLEAGRLVLRGMRNNDLYILTHPEYEQIMKDRNEAIMASIPKDLHPTDARLAMARSMSGNSIYVSERDRKRCSQPE